MTDPAIVYSWRDAGSDAPSPTARWAVEVRTGEEDPQPRLLAWATSELAAKNLVLALRRSHRITLDHAQHAGEGYDRWLRTRARV